MSQYALVRLRFIAVAVGALAFALAACSGDARDGDGGRSSGAGGSAGGTDIAANGSLAGNGGGARSSGGSGAGGATYTAAQACQRFAQASCAKGQECGLVLAQTGSALICVQCDALSLGFIQAACEQDAPGDKNAADIDRCLANLAAQPCAEACVDPEVDGCEVFSELAAAQSNTLVCDARCIDAAR
jgi:hypothetical protein